MVLLHFQNIILVFIYYVMFDVLNVYLLLYLDLHKNLHLHAIIINHGLSFYAVFA